MPVPQEALEPEVTRSLGAHWALWLAVGLILLILAVGYIRRKWRARGAQRPGGSRGAGRDEGGDAFGVVEIEHRQPAGVGGVIGSDGDDSSSCAASGSCVGEARRRTSILGIGALLKPSTSDDVGPGEMSDEVGERGRRVFLPVPGSLPGGGRDDDGLDSAGARVPLAVGRCRRGGRRSWCVCLTVATLSPR